MAETKAAAPAPQAVHEVAFEEDAFEDFELTETDAAAVAGEETGELWQADWDDEDIEGDFQEKLKAELDKGMQE